jgi:hypothetical protein
VALDKLGLAMIASRVKGASILCLGYPDITVPARLVEEFLKVTPRKFTDHGHEHKVAHPLPETIDTLTLAGALVVDCVDSMPSRGVERQVDLNERQDWPRAYDLVINPGTIEHCFDVSTAMFNAWRALKVGGAILHAAPMTMLNHGFYNFCPTLFVDFAQANGGAVLEMRARDREWKGVPIEPMKRFRAPEETVLYALVQKAADVPEMMPVQGRYQK